VPEPRDAQDFLPLTHLSLSILLALGDGRAHGYAIIKRIERESGGRTRPGAGSLYAALDRLVSDGLIEESGPSPGEDQRRRYYGLTPMGRRVTRAEAARLAEVLAVANVKGLAP
jgi:DNA-binding PadR family transcriptional regulator